MGCVYFSSLDEFGNIQIARDRQEAAKIFVVLSLPFIWNFELNFVPLLLLLKIVYHKCLMIFFFFFFFFGFEKKIGQKIIKQN